MDDLSDAPSADDEYVFRQTRRKKTPRDKDPAPAKPPSWRKPVSWALIVVLGIAAVAEFRAQWLFKRNLRVCREAVERSEDGPEKQKIKVTYEQVKDRFTSQPKVTKGVHSFAPCVVYTWQWQGVRRYRIRLVADEKTGTLFDVLTQP